MTPMPILFAGGTHTADYWLLGFLVLALAMMVFARKVEERAERLSAQKKAHEQRP